ncbi:hypothetical protein PR048_019865 [Dryococelus australis]|uniref:Reverse transcriptase domain-containing protein n=1 Tax=Dryococelus australis TaxID=614101 RepID=A0ABQ9H4M5_9NEOP|nr:hypothetical protein PR048_019865 [Dryococelus australis]
MQDERCTTIEEDRLQKLLELRSIHSSFTFTSTNENSLTEIIKSLKNNISVGIHDVPVKLIKFCVHSLTLPLTIIFNKCSNNGIFPDSLKAAKVILLHKKGNETDALEELDNKYLVAEIFAELSKAFDCVNHKLLLQKMIGYGIKDSSLQMFKSYLSNRTHQVCLSQCNNKNNFIEYRSNTSDPYEGCAPDTAPPFQITAKGTLFHSKCPHGVTNAVYTLLSLLSIDWQKAVLRISPHLLLYHTRSAFNMRMRNSAAALRISIRCHCVLGPYHLMYRLQ